MIYKSIDELIGKTPLYEAVAYKEKNELESRLLLKIECFNPAGSVKDRAAYEMITDAEKKGLLKKGATIIEPTSGNTGIGLAAVGVPRGYRVILTMPETMSIERRKLLKAYGAEIILTPGEEGMRGAIVKAQELLEKEDNAYMPSQFANHANAMAHKKTTGPEIWEDTCGEIDIFVAGVGTGGTLTGVGEYLKKKNSKIEVVAVEPYDSPVLSQGKVGAHGIQGIGANFVPEILNEEIIDEIVTVKTEEAYNASRELVKCEGLLVGISSGAALYAATCLAKKPENRGKTIVVLLPDTGERYLSTPIFD